MPKDKEPSESWKKEFDRVLGWRFNIGVVPDDTTKETVKHFIRTAIATAIAEERKRLLEALPKSTNVFSAMPATDGVIYTKHNEHNWSKIESPNEE